MKRILYLLFLGCLPAAAFAQWTETAPNLLGPISQAVGAMTYEDGILWAGARTLWNSTDKGVTWTENSLALNGPISHIYFLDRNDGLVTTHSGSIYRTSDGGTTWINILNLASATSACFLDSSSNILVSEFITPGTVHFSRDGGTTWNTFFIDTWIREIIPLTGGQAYLLAGDWSPGEHIWFTSDYGASWTEKSGLLDADCWSFALDPCRPKRMYVVNEGYSQTVAYDGLSRIFVSTDDGDSWVVTSNHHSDYYAGSITLGPHSIFCQTVSEASVGLVRSMDSGETWTNINGPSSSADTRLIAALDDNHIVAFDNNGSAWITSNSGGDSITLPQALSALLVPAVVSDAGSSCNTLDTTIPVGVLTCRAITATLDSAWLTGSLAFALGQGTFPRTLNIIDSIPISYAPSLGTADTAWLHLRYELGSGVRDTTVLLTGTASALTVNPQFLHREAASAYYGQLDSLPMAVDLGSNINLDSLWPYLTDIQGTFAFDSSVVSFASYNPPSGWVLSSLANRGNSVDFGIHKISAKAGKPLALGTALFSPNSDQLATSWVTLPRFVMEIGGKDVSLCVTQNEDSHWSVKTLGELSDVGMTNAADTKDISVYPNPASDRLFVRNPFDRSVAITIYDAIGRVVLSTVVPAGSTSTVSFASLPCGMYIVSDHSGACEIVSHE